MGLDDKNGGPCVNTDRELYREQPGDYYAASLHVTEGGGIGINVGGSVYVKPLREWHKLAGGPIRFPADPSHVAATAPVDPESEAANPVWDLVIHTCAQAWPAGTLTWDQSPTELIVKIINERDEARADLLARSSIVTIPATVLDELLEALALADKINRHEWYDRLKGYRIPKQATSSTIAEYFKHLRFDPAHHLGCGDVRLTIAQQDEIASLPVSARATIDPALIERANKIKETLDEYVERSQNLSVIQMAADAATVIEDLLARADGSTNG